MTEFMRSQKKRIEEDRWFEGCRINKDPGSEFVLNWIRLNAGLFRKSWEKSLCKKCELCVECGHNVKLDCTNFKKKMC